MSQTSGWAFLFFTSEFLKMTVANRKTGLLFSPPFVFPCTDEILALSQHHCGGAISLDQGRVGTINLTLPGRFNDTSAVNNGSSQTDQPLPVSVCTWVIDIPLGCTVHLTLSRSDRGSTVWVRCAGNRENHVLVSGGTVALSHCDGNKGALLWGAAGQTSNSIRLSYYGMNP